MTKTNFNRNVLCSQGGFTLVELIMGIVIAGILLISVSVAYRQIVVAMANNSYISRASSVSELP